MMSITGIIHYMAKSFSTLFSMQPTLCNNKPCTLKCTWDVTHIISMQNRNHSNYAVLVLNRPLTQSQNFFSNFWNNAAVRVAVDGGMKQWDTYIEKLPDDAKKSIRLPDLVTGDFDSIPADIHKKYKDKGCQMIHTPDQNHTDFTKAVIELHVHCLKKKIEIDHIVAFGQSSGRLDQVLGNIQTLFLVEEKDLVSRHMKLYLMTDDAVSWLLGPGEHTIKIPKETLEHKRAWCSLVPIGEACLSVTTTGLKWNLIDHPLRFGDLVSTSNTFDGSEYITVTCSHTLLWSMRIPMVSDQAIQNVGLQPSK